MAKVLISLLGYLLFGVTLGYYQSNPVILYQTEYRQIKTNEVCSFTAECTAYTAGYESTGKTPEHPAYGLTASGQQVRKGIVAADTNVLPFGTKLYIDGLGIFEVQDTGSDIKGQRIDIYYDDLNDAIKFGRQQRKVYILE